MSYWQNSTVYKMLAGSCFFGWLVVYPEDKSHRFRYSIVWKVTNWLINGVVGLLQYAGKFLKQQGNSSLVINNPSGFLGLLAFFYFAFDLVLNDLTALRAAVETALAAGGLLMLLVKPVPGIWRGSVIFKVLNWWERT
ncbi:MAG: hypothetical protein H5T98_10650 [Syntrophomonadaceae bacterium]|nr:hypothetical protein [Syntrophomonadaceae bacterium]